MFQSTGSGQFFTNRFFEFYLEWDSWVFRWDSVVEVYKGWFAAIVWMLDEERWPRIGDPRIRVSIERERDSSRSLY